MWRILWLLLPVLTLQACAPSDSSAARTEMRPGALPIVSFLPHRIRVVGSSTVAPFSITVAEHFGETTDYLTPIVESTGTGGGFKTFCEGIGADKASIINASRRIKPAERDLCRRRGITDLIEIKIGYDGIVLANDRSGPAFDLTKQQIFQALAAELPDAAGIWRRNRVKRWSEIDPSLPDQPIIIAGPPPTSGTRDAFHELVMVPGALALPELKKLHDTDRDAARARIGTIRNDGVWIDTGENDNSIINMLLRNDEAIGVLGYSFLQQNLDRVQAARIGGVMPAFDNIFSGQYGISRSMFIYVKPQHRHIIPGLSQYVAEFTAEHAWGPEGYLIDKGLIPLLPEDRRKMRAQSLAALQ